MEIASLVGIIGGIAVVVVVMNITGGMLLYWDLTSLIIVVGGAFFATMFRFTMASFINGLRAGAVAFKGGLQDEEELVNEIIECANVARKGSILSLEKHPVKNDFLAKSVRNMVDGIDPEIIDAILSLEMDNMKKRHKDGQDVMDYMGEATPAYGMIGTVIGLIVIMANLSDPSKIGPGLAVALVTTLYGSLFANMFFIPMASKLKYISRQELKNMQIIREGIKGLLAGENPKIIRSRLSSFIGGEKE